MARKRALERRLSAVSGFPDPDSTLEQYQTPADHAAHVVHLAAELGDITDKRVIDLGTGTGMLALAAALNHPRAVHGIDVDRTALRIARENEAIVAPPISIEWIQADATRHPLCVDTPVTVLMNPPFGAHRGKRHADRRFLRATTTIADVSYSFHNENSRAFIDSFAADHGGTVTHAYAVEFPLPHQFDHHDQANETITAELYRIEWQPS